MVQGRKENYTLYPDADEIICTAEGYPVLPQMLGDVVRRILAEDGDTRDYEIVAKRFGIDSSKCYTLDELGIWLGVSRERVRQIEARTLQVLHTFFTGGKLRRVRVSLHPKILDEIRLFINLIQKEGPLVSEATIWRMAEARYEISLTPSQKAFLRVLLEAFQLTRITLYVAQKRLWPPMWLITAQRKVEVKKASQAVASAFREQVTPISFFDFAIEVNRRFRKQPISHEILRTLLATCPLVEAVGDDLYRTCFSALTNHAQRVHRILADNGEPMTIRDITKDLNHRLAQAGEPPATTTSVSTQCTTDSNLVSIGHTVWSLKSWGKEARTILELMESFFHIHKRAATPDEVADYVQSKRPASRSSIQIYLTNDRRFRRVGPTTYELAAWGNPAFQVRRVHRVKRESLEAALRDVFKQRNAPELPFSQVVRDLGQRLGYSESRLRAKIRHSPLLHIVDKPGQRLYVRLSTGSSSEPPA